MEWPLDHFSSTHSRIAMIYTNKILSISITILESDVDFDKIILKFQNLVHFQVKLPKIPKIRLLEKWKNLKVLIINIWLPLGKLWDFENLRGCLPNLEKFCLEISTPLPAAAKTNLIQELSHLRMPKLVNTNLKIKDLILDIDDLDQILIQFGFCHLLKTPPIFGIQNCSLGHS
jgi:hypothetical protein